LMNKTSPKHSPRNVEILKTSPKFPDTYKRLILQQTDKVRKCETPFDVASLMHETLSKQFERVNWHVHCTLQSANAWRFSEEPDCFMLIAIGQWLVEIVDFPQPTKLDEANKKVKLAEEKVSAMKSEL
jgi:hypothetical protein